MDRSKVILFDITLEIYISLSVDLHIQWPSSKRTADFLNDPHRESDIPTDPSLGAHQILSGDSLGILLKPLRLFAQFPLQLLLIRHDQGANLNIETVAPLCVIAAADKGQAGMLLVW